MAYLLIFCRSSSFSGVEEKILCLFFSESAFLCYSFKEVEKKILNPQMVTLIFAIHTPTHTPP